MSCLPCSVVGTSSARRFAPVARSFRVLWLCEWRRTPRASTSEVGRLPRLRWPATDGLGQTRLGTVYSAPASNRPAKTSVAGASAPPPTAGGVKLLFRCLAPHEAVIPLDCKAELWKRKELWKREANSRTNRTVTKRSVACWLKLPESGLKKTLQRAQSLAVVRGLSARAVECARLGPSGCPPRGQGAPLRPRGSFPRLALACARATIPAAARRGVGARRCCASHRPFRHPRSLGAEKGAEALRHTRKTHKRTNR